MKDISWISCTKVDIITLIVKILYIHQYFRTPEEGGAIRSYHISQAMQQAGHQVELITATNQDKDYSTDINGVKVHYLSVFYANRLSFFQRIQAFIDFYRKAFRKAMQIDGIDLIYATSTPLTVGHLGRKLKKKKKVKMIFEVRDLWPLVPIDMGIIRPKILHVVLYRLEKKIYQDSDQIIALSPMMKSYISERSDPEKIHCVPNMADIDFWRDALKETPSDLKASKIIAYTGTLGPANDLQQLLNLAKTFQDKGRGDYQWWIIGEGKEKKNLQDFDQKHQLMHVHFFEAINKKALREKMKEVDAMYISFASYASLQTCSPNKYFDALASGKVVFTNFDGWIAEEIQSQSTGIRLSDDPNKAFAQITKLSSKDWNMMSKNAYQSAHEYDRKSLCHLILQILKR